jgi:hypothetical protein
VPKSYDEEKITSSTNVDGKTGAACRKLKLDPCLSHCTILIQSRLRTLISTSNLETSPGKSREYAGNNRHRQGLPQ